MALDLKLVHHFQCFSFRSQNSNMQSKSEHDAEMNSSDSKDDDLKFDPNVQRHHDRERAPKMVAKRNMESVNRNNEQATHS